MSPPPLAHAWLAAPDTSLRSSSAASACALAGGGSATSSPGASTSTPASPVASTAIGAGRGGSAAANAAGPAGGGTAEATGASHGRRPPPNAQSRAARSARADMCKRYSSSPRLRRAAPAACARRSCLDRWAGLALCIVARRLALGVSFAHAVSSAMAATGETPPARDELVPGTMGDSHVWAHSSRRSPQRDRFTWYLHSQCAKRCRLCARLMPFQSALDDPAVPLRRLTPHTGHACRSALSPCGVPRSAVVMCSKAKWSRCTGSASPSAQRREDRR